MINVDPKYALPPGQFIDEPTHKDLLVLHHTVGGSALSSVEWWKRDPKRVGTAFIIDRDGQIYQCFDPNAWAYHLGLKGTNGSVDKRSIGIELASEGGLIEKDGVLYCFDRISQRTAFARLPIESLPITTNHFRNAVYDHGTIWRGAYRYFCRYGDQQMGSLVWLTNHILDLFPTIPRVTPEWEMVQHPIAYRGVVGHHHFRKDKTDLHPGFDWKLMMTKCNLTFG